jgi:hypothetical protein
LILAALLNSKEEANPTKDISEDIGLATSKHADWIRTERGLTRSLRALIKSG